MFKTRVFFIFCKNVAINEDNICHGNLQMSCPFWGKSIRPLIIQLFIHMYIPLFIAVLCVCSDTHLQHMKQRQINFSLYFHDEYVQKNRYLFTFQDKNKKRVVYLRRWKNMQKLFVYMLHIPKEHYWTKKSKMKFYILNWIELRITFP